MIFSGKKITQGLAGLLLVAILMDTDHFSSSLTTTRDREIAEYLMPIAEIEDVPLF